MSYHVDACVVRLVEWLDVVALRIYTRIEGSL